MGTHLVIVLYNSARPRVRVEIKQVHTQYTYRDRTEVHSVEWVHTEVQMVPLRVRQRTTRSSAP